MIDIIVEKIHSRWRSERFGSYGEFGSYYVSYVDMKSPYSRQSRETISPSYGRRKTCSDIFFFSLTVDLKEFLRTIQISQLFYSLGTNFTKK